jgi:hypothetical protein
MARESDSQAVANMIEAVIQEAETKYDHQSLSSLEVTCFIREQFERRYDKWQGLDA